MGIKPVGIDDDTGGFVGRALAWLDNRFRAKSDTGWIGLSSYFADGSVSGRIIDGNIAVLRGFSGADVSIGTGLTDITSSALPSGWRPAGNTWGAAYSQGYSLSVLIRSDGTLAVSNNNPVEITSNVSFSLVYFIG